MKNLSRERPRGQKAKKGRKDQEPTRNLHCRRKHSERYLPNALDWEADVHNRKNEPIKGRRRRWREAMGLGDMTWRGMESDPRKPQRRVYVKNRALTWGWFCLYRGRRREQVCALKSMGFPPKEVFYHDTPVSEEVRELGELRGILGTWRDIVVK